MDGSAQIFYAAMAAIMLPTKYICRSNGGVLLAILMTSSLPRAFLRRPYHPTISIVTFAFEFQTIRPRSTNARNAIHRQPSRNFLSKRRLLPQQYPYMKCCVEKGLNTDNGPSPLLALNRNETETKSTTTIEDNEAFREPMLDEEDLANMTMFESDSNGDDEDGNSMEVRMDPAQQLQPGTTKGFQIIHHYSTSLTEPFDLESAVSSGLLSPHDIERLELTPTNVSLPVALMVLDPEAYPSQSRSRKACRKANILIHRGPLKKVPRSTMLVPDEASDDNASQEDRDTVDWFDPEKCIRGNVGDRVYPGDVVAKQVRIGDGYFAVMNYKKPPFELPILYEDDHFAIVNKPAGVVVFANRKGGDGIMTVRSMLPFVLTPPKVGTYATIRRPQPVHRLDKPTSGILLVAKTKPAMVDLCMQFHDRKIQKSYIAVVNGIPPEPIESSITSEFAENLFGHALDNDPICKESKSSNWQLIDYPLDDKHAITAWRAIRYAKSIKANDGYVTLVELKPRTGRYHQLRRHLAWVCERPIIGDSDYDGGGPTAMCFRDRGLFLCSNSVTLEHPFFNSPQGSKEFNESLLSTANSDVQNKDGHEYSTYRLWKRDDGKIMVSVTISPPSKFENFMNREEERYVRFSEEST